MNQRQASPIVQLTPGVAGLVIELLAQGAAMFRAEAVSQTNRAIDLERKLDEKEEA